MKDFSHITRGIGPAAIAATLFVALSATPVQAGLDEAEAAFKTGEYDKAHKELQPLMRKKRKPLRGYGLLARMYLKGLGVAVNYSLAYKNLLKPANRGDSWAQTELGKLYAAGNGPPQSFVTANSYFKKAAEHNYGPAQLAFGDAHMRGLGLRKDAKLAYIWFNLAAVNLKKPARDKAIEKRDQAAGLLSAAVLAAAQDRSLELSELMKDAEPVDTSKKPPSKAEKLLKKAAEAAASELKKAAGEVAKEVAKELDTAATKAVIKADKPAKAK